MRRGTKRERERETERERGRERGGGVHFTSLLKKWDRSLQSDSSNCLVLTMIVSFLL